MKLFTKLFGLYYKLLYLCTVIRTQLAKAVLSAGARTRPENKQKGELRLRADVDEPSV